MLCRKKDEGPEGALYAMKTLRKQALVKRNQLEHTATERNILQNIQHPFLVNMKFAFQVPRERESERASERERGRLRERKPLLLPSEVPPFLLWHGRGGAG
jgi:serine/threonine protein kinase